MIFSSPGPSFLPPPRINTSAFLSVSFFRSLSPSAIVFLSLFYQYSLLLFSLSLSRSRYPAFSLPRTSRAMNSR